MKKKINKIRKHTKEVKKQVKDKILTLLVSAFGLVAALAWNDTIKAIFKEIFGEQEHILAMFGYAVIVTILVVILTIWIGKLSSED